MTLFFGLRKLASLAILAQNFQIYEIFNALYKRGALIKALLYQRDLAARKADQIFSFDILKYAVYDAARGV